MANIGIGNSKVLIYNSAVQFGCECCCKAPEYQSLWPASGTTLYVNPGMYVNPLFQVTLRYTDTINLYTSTDNQSTYQLVGTSGSGGFNAFGPGTGYGSTPTYSSTYTGPWSMYPVSPIGSYGFIPYYAGNVWWYMSLVNDCGQTTKTPTRLLRIKSTADPDPIITCNGCPRNALKYQYALTFAGLDGDFNYFLSNNTWTMQHYGAVSTCNWAQPGYTGAIPYVFLTWSVSRWVLTALRSTNPAGSNLCGFRLNGPTNPCQPIGTYTYASSWCANCSGGTTCPPVGAVAVLEGMS